jgi:hypothetical protein
MSSMDLSDSKSGLNRAPQLLACLSDPERIRFAGDIVGGLDSAALTEKYGEKTFQKHLSRFVSCGLVQAEYEPICLRMEVFASALEEVHALRSAARGPAPIDRTEINECFDGGRIRALPQNKERLGHLLSWIAEWYFSPGAMTEREVDLVLKTFGDDHATLRRQLVDHGYMWRTADGSEYRITQNLADGDTEWVGL